MRFRRLDLIRYGKFTEKSVAFPTSGHDFHMVIGPNEAGKSTLRSSILDLLFGIPTRSTHGFLHPLNELRLGAQVENAQGSLEFHRAKAQKQTLRSPADAVLPDDTLAAFLGSADRTFFDHMFGLDHGRLVAGGNSILNAEDDVGQVLFQSAAGVASLGKVREALEEEAGKLWAPRRSSERAYYIASDLLDEASRELKEATVRTKAWSEAHDKVEAVRSSLKDARDRHQSLQEKRSRLERVRRLSPYLRALRECENQLAGLAATPELPEGAAGVFAAAEAQLAQARERLKFHEGTAGRERDQLAGIRMDATVLGLAEDIKRLEEHRLQYAPYRRDIERREGEVASHWQAALNACVQLGWTADSEEAVSAKMPSLLTRREVGALAQERGALYEALKAAEAATGGKRDELARLGRQLDGAQTSRLGPALRLALARARELGDTAAELRRKAGAVAAAKASLDRLSAGLGRWNGSLQALAELPVPSQPLISRLVQERQVLKSDLKAAGRQLEQEKHALLEIETEIRQFQELHHPVTHQDVLEARRVRDASWQGIRAGESLAAAAAGFESLLRQADELGDQELATVGDATQLQNLRHGQERQQNVLSGANDRHASNELDLQAFDARWHALVSGLGLEGMAPEEMGDWLLTRERVLAAAAGHQAAVDEHAAAVALDDAARTDLFTAMSGEGLAVPADSPLASLRIEAEEHSRKVAEAELRYEEWSRQLAEATAAVQRLEQDLTAARSALASWKERWAKALSVLGLPTDSELATVSGALELLSLIEDRLGKMKQIRAERIDTMRADLKRFRSDADRIAGLVGLDAEGMGPGEIAQELAARLEAAKQSRIAIARHQEAIQEAEAFVRTEQEKIGQAEASLAPLLERAGVVSSRDLAEAIRVSDLKRSLVAEAAAAMKTLLDGGGGLPRSRIEEEVDASDPDEVAGELTRVEEELAWTVQKLNELTGQSVEAERALSAIGGADAAAKAEGRRQEALAQMSDVVERYVRVHTAARLLRWSIDRYREDKQGPLLQRAGAIFSTLTLGAFQKLIVDYEQKPLALEGLRPDGKAVGIAGMSEGTRDQLYLALRLAALELHIEQAKPLPFVADDLFINFDDRRAKAGLTALKELSGQTQVIFLSHHDHLMPAVQEVFGADVNVVMLGEI